MSGKRKYLAIVGVDGSGKTTITDWLRDELASRGHQPGFIWSRFNNFTSLPFLALARLTGHNRYEEIEGKRTGFHDFEEIPRLLRYIFIITQAIDVNIANLVRLRWPTRKHKIVICERGPWDTLVDVAADTGMYHIVKSSLYRLYCGSLINDTRMLYIERDPKLILGVRTELEFDIKLPKRVAAYRDMAAGNDWAVIDNNGSIEQTKASIRQWLDDNDY